MDSIDRQPWLTDLKRRVQHYGYRYDYKARQVDPRMFLGKLPNWVNGLAIKLHADRLFPLAPDQVIVNEYQPGQGIASHVDCEPCFADTIASLSLGSPCVMVFTNIADGNKQSLLLERRSLLILAAQARYRWQHGIPARKSDAIEEQRITRERRVSLTFRNVVVSST